MFQINNLTKKFKKKEVLHDIELELGTGVYGLLGENGAGKSTLIRCILGLYGDYSGEISYEGKKICNEKIGIGYLPQHFNGLEELKVSELLKYFADAKKIPKRDINTEINRVLELVNLAERKNCKVRALSGGMKQRVGIAQTLLGNPNLLVYDEPTTGLDPKERIRFENIIEEIKREKVILISTHIVSDIECLCDKIIVMKEGNVLGVYTPLELASCAEGKVYEISEDECESDKGNTILIRKSLCDNKFKIRILSENKIPGKSVEPTVEDGYLWVSR